MRIELSEEQQLLRDTVRRFAAEVVAPRAREIAASGEFPLDFFHRAGELGLAGVYVPEEYGGAGMDEVAYCVAIEEISRVCASSGVILSVNNSLVCDPLLAYGNEEQKRELLAPLASGRKQGCFALTEAEAGSNAAALRTTARRDGDRYLLDGGKVFITNGTHADLALVFATVDPERKHRGITALRTSTPPPSRPFRTRYGVSPEPETLKADKGLNAKWVAFKTEALDRHVGEIVKTVRAYRPGAAVAPNIYSSVVTNPDATTWFAQDFKGYLEKYDYTVVMAYAAMEGKKDSRKWYRELFEAAGGRENAARVVFKLQAYDWKGEKWVSDQAMKDDLTFLLSLGARHVAYYPDDVYRNKPDVDAVAVILSARDEVKRKQAPPEAAPEGALERLFRRLFSSNP